MTHEPMLNIREKAPLVIMGALIVAHVIQLILPETMLSRVQPWLILSPVDIDGVSLLQKLISLPGHSLLHADFTHLLMNSFMIVAFGVVTIQGLRADIRLRPQILSPLQKFFLIFILGVIGGGVFQWGWWALSGQFGFAIGASGGGSALFAAMAYAIGGRDRLLKFGLGWGAINLIFALFGTSLGVNIAWAAHIGGFVLGVILAIYWVRPNSTSFKLN